MGTGRPTTSGCASWRTKLVDNVTHSLVGVVLADAMMGRRSPKSQRPLIVGAGLIAANLPDIDLAYAAITPAPVGYLLHHRGHTHTIVGLGLLAVALVLVYRLLPPVRTMRLAERLRLWLLIAVALASHLAMDALNSYGVHPFYPVDNSWYYADAVFIFEPSLWLVLGVAVAWNARSGASRLAAALPIFDPARHDCVDGRRAARIRSGAGRGRRVVRVARETNVASGQSPVGTECQLLIVVALVAVSLIARTAVLGAMQPQLRGRLVDVILTPNPASPLCWGVIAIESIEAREDTCCGAARFRSIRRSRRRSRAHHISSPRPVKSAASPAAAFCSAAKFISRSANCATWPGAIAGRAPGSDSAERPSLWEQRFSICVLPSAGLAGSRICHLSASQATRGARLTCHSGRCRARTCSFPRHWCCEEMQKH